MRETVQTIQEKVNTRAWEQSGDDERKAKIQRYKRGDSLGTDIPDVVKQQLESDRIRRKILLVVLMIGFVLVVG